MSVVDFHERSAVPLGAAECITTVEGTAGAAERPEGDERMGTSLITAGRVEDERETEKACGNHEEQAKL